jgi:hypothetical protein
MDNDRYAFFLAKYRSMSKEELADVAERGATLSDEAVKALEEVLGVTIKSSSANADSEISPGSAERTPGAIAEQVRVSRELWRGGWSGMCQVQFLLTGAALPLKLHLGLVAVILCSSLGASIGYRITRSICAAEDRTIEQKRSELRRLSAGMWVVMFLSYVIAQRLARG